MKRFLIFLLFVAVAAGGALIWERVNFEAPGPSPTYKVVLVNPGDHVTTIAARLEDAGVIANAALFGAGVRLRGLQSRLKAGEYGFPARVSMADVADILVSGRSIQHKLTVAEGLTSRMIFELVRADPALVGDPGEVPPEGSLLPETYLFTRGATRADILRRMNKAQETLLASLWAARAPGLPYETPEQAVIMASIVEKETAIPVERRHIAAVFANRLRLGMKLQSDPTVIYDISEGYPLGRGIRESELERASAHNTYVIDGLPPTPICNPGKDSLEAVLHPADSKDLYFVADGTGGHVFSATVEEHEKNVAKWRAIENPAPPPPPPVSHHRRKLSKRRHAR
jgi:UPF0755 protein